MRQLVHRCPNWSLLWLAIGIIAIRFDPMLQPMIAGLGRAQTIQRVALHWQDLGTVTGIPLFLLVGLLLILRDRGHTLRVFLVCVLLASALSFAGKWCCGRVRPDRMDGHTRFCGPFGLVPHSSGAVDSMPSGHTTAAFAMATALTWRWRRAAVLWYLLAIGVAISRVLVNRHFPSDVIIGAWIGTAAAWAICRNVPATWPRSVLPPVEVDR